MTIKRNQIKMALDNVPAKNESNDKFFQEMEKVRMQYQNNKSKN